MSSFLYKQARNSVGLIRLLLWDRVFLMAYPYYKELYTLGTGSSALKRPFEDSVGDDKDPNKKMKRNLRKSKCSNSPLCFQRSIVQGELL